VRLSYFKLTFYQLLELWLARLGYQGFFKQDLVDKPVNVRSTK